MTEFPTVFPESSVGTEQVVAAFIAPVKVGEIPNGAAILLSDYPYSAECPYKVSCISLRDGKWGAYDSRHDLSITEAWDVFNDRAVVLRGQG